MLSTFRIVFFVVAIFCLLISTACSNSSGSDSVAEADPVMQDVGGDTSLADAEIELSPTKINTFLWKPESERNGRLVVLIDPVGIRIEVTGLVSETLVDSGPSNGRGTTGRGNFSGCSFGNDVKVEFFDGKNRRVTLASGARAVTVPRGCDRFQI